MLAFGQLAEILGSSVQLHDVHDTNALRQYLQEKYPAIKKIAFKTAVNKKIISSNTAIDANTTIALLPPFSGG